MVTDDYRWESTVLCSSGQFPAHPSSPFFPTGACRHWELLSAENYTFSIWEQCWETCWRTERLIIITGVVIEKTKSLGGLTTSFKCRKQFTSRISSPPGSRSHLLCSVCSHVANMALLTDSSKTWQAWWQMASSNSAEEENCKNSNFVKKYATEHFSGCTVLIG